MYKYTSRITRTIRDHYLYSQIYPDHVSSIYFNCYNGIKQLKKEEEKRQF